MAGQLWLLRHGDAEPHGTRPDHERELTARGVEQARAAGAALRALSIQPAAVYASPRVRARDTALHACEQLGVQPVEHSPLSGGFDARGALALAMSEPGGSAVLLVGHEPDMSQIVHDLTGARIDMKKGGVAGLRLDGGHGRLLALLRPRELAAIR